MLTQDRPALPAGYMEQNTGHAPLAQKEIPRLSSPVDIVVKSYRTRSCDTDGISAKAVIDGLVLSGILQGDTAEWIRKVTFLPVEKPTNGEERTEIYLNIAESS